MKLRHNEDEVSLLEFFSEGGKLLALCGILVMFGLFAAAYGCKHQACHAPDTWQGALQSIGLGD